MSRSKCGLKNVTLSRIQVVLYIASANMSYGKPTFLRRNICDQVCVKELGQRPVRSLLTEIESPVFNPFYVVALYI